MMFRAAANRVAETTWTGSESSWLGKRLLEGAWSAIHNTTLEAKRLSMFFCGKLSDRFSGPRTTYLNRARKCGVGLRTKVTAQFRFETAWRRSARERRSLVAGSATSRQ